MFCCSKCGICCKNIAKIPELKEYDNGHGTCIHLRKDNLCDIYPVRPDICNVEKMFELKYKNYMSRDEYDQLNQEGCMTLRSKMNKAN